jgi:hypothetical protein
MGIKARRNDCSEIPEHTWSEYTMVQGIEYQYVISQVTTFAFIRTITCMLYIVFSVNSSVVQY